MLALKTFFRRRLLRQSLGCEKTGGETQHKRTITTAHSFCLLSQGRRDGGGKGGGMGRKEKVLDFHITSTSRLCLSSSPGSGEG